MNITNEILKYAEEITPKLIEIRRTIHKYPEQGFEINKTAKLVINYLKSLEIEVINNDKTGIVGILKGREDGKTVLLRADMDALPICELNNIEYRSQRQNLMHACGHDAHTTWLLGAATILSNLKENINGTVKFAFQPSEEGSGGIGAKDMIKSGILENPKVDVAIAAHVFPEIEIGKIGVKSGGVTSTPSGFKIKVIGKSGHASEPSKCIDPIMILNQIYIGIQSIQRVTLPPDHPGVISVTNMKVGQAHNIISDCGEMSGTIRTFSIDDNKKLASAIEKISNNVANMYGASCEFSYNIPIGSSINNKKVSDMVKNSAKKIMMLEDNIIDPPIFMGGDDFCFYTEKVPSCYFFVGVANKEKGIIYPIHSDKFDLDERCLSNTSAIMAQFTIDYLKGEEI